MSAVVFCPPWPFVRLPNCPPALVGSCGGEMEDQNLPLCCRPFPLLSSLPPPPLLLLLPVPSFARFVVYIESSLTHREQAHSCLRDECILLLCYHIHTQQPFTTTCGFAYPTIFPHQRYYLSVCVCEAIVIKYLCLERLHAFIRSILRILIKTKLFTENVVLLRICIYYWQCNFPYDPVCLSLGGSLGLLDGWLVSRSVCHNFLKERGKLHFHAPI